MFNYRRWIDCPYDSVPTLLILCIKYGIFQPTPFQKLIPLPNSSFQQILLSLAAFPQESQQALIPPSEAFSWQCRKYYYRVSPLWALREVCHILKGGFVYINSTVQCRFSQDTFEF